MLIASHQAVNLILYAAKVGITQTPAQPKSHSEPRGAPRRATADKNPENPSTEHAVSILWIIRSALLRSE